VPQVKWLRWSSTDSSEVVLILKVVMRDSLFHDDKTLRSDLGWFLLEKVEKSIFAWGGRRGLCGCSVACN